MSQIFLWELVERKGTETNGCEFGTILHSGGTSTWTHGRFVTDHSEVMAFIARPRSEALGARHTDGLTNFDLKEPSLRYPFGTDRSEHSGQYERPIQKTHKFFNMLLDSMDVGFNPLTDVQVGDAAP